MEISPPNPLTKRNLSNIDLEATSLELDQVKFPPTRGRSTRLCSEIKAENRCIVVVKFAEPKHSEGNYTILKSPPTHQGTSHQLHKSDNSSHMKWCSMHLIFCVTFNLSCMINFATWLSDSPISLTYYFVWTKMYFVLLKFLTIGHISDKPCYCVICHSYY